MSGLSADNCSNVTEDDVTSIVMVRRMLKKINYSNQFLQNLIDSILFVKTAINEVSKIDSEGVR